jgi:hypothetical protein
MRVLASVAVAVSVSVVVASVALTAGIARADVGDTVEITAGSVTGLGCAVEAQRSNRLELLAACALAEAQNEIVVFDVAERTIYRLAKKKVPRYELERAYGGGSIDLSGKVVAVDPKSGIATVEVAEYSITRKPKPGAFKGCL